MTTKCQCEQEKDQSEASFIWSKLVMNRRFTWLLELPGRADFLYISLQKLGKPLTGHEEQKGWLDVKGDPWIGRSFTLFRW